MKYQKLKQKPVEEQNLSPEEQESPQPEAPQNSGPEAAKKSGMRWLIAGFVLVLVMLGLYFFVVPMLQDAGEDDTDAPPRASMDQGGKFQGAIFDGPMNMLVYDQNDRRAYDSIRSAEKSKTTTIEKNVGYYHSDNNLTVEEIYKCIDPKAEQILFMFYSPGEKIGSTNLNKGFYTFPKGPFVSNRDTQFYEAGADFVVPAGRGFVIISKRESTAHCFNSQNEKSKINVTNPVVTGEKGWIMIAATDDQLSKVVAPYTEYIRSVWIQEGIVPEQILNNQGKYERTLARSKMVWLKLDGPTAEKSTAIKPIQPEKKEPPVVAEVQNPGPPTNLSAKFIENPQGVSLTWEPPTSNGGSPIKSYTVSFNKGDDVYVVITTSVTESSYLVLNSNFLMKPKMEYAFEVKAINEAGKESAYAKFPEVQIPATDDGEKVQDTAATSEAGATGATAATSEAGAAGDAAAGSLGAMDEIFGEEGIGKKLDPTGELSKINPNDPFDPITGGIDPNSPIGPNNPIDPSPLSQYGEIMDTSEMLDGIGETIDMTGITDGLLDLGGVGGGGSAKSGGPSGPGATGQGGFK